MEKFHFLLDLLIRHHRAMSRSFLSLLTAGGQTIFSKIVFQCPCDDKLKIPYSFLFLFVPALVLFLLGYLLSSKVEQVVTGCCAGDQRGTLKKTKMFCKKVTCSQMTLAALLAPFIWIAMALLEGGYFVCMCGTKGACVGSATVSRCLARTQTSQTPRTSWLYLRLWFLQPHEE